MPYRPTTRLLPPLLKGFTAKRNGSPTAFFSTSTRLSSMCTKTPTRTIRILARLKWSNRARTFSPALTASMMSVFTVALIFRTTSTWFSVAGTSSTRQRSEIGTMNWKVPTAPAISIFTPSPSSTKPNPFPIFRVNFSSMVTVMPTWDLKSNDSVLGPSQWKTSQLM